MRFTLKEWDLIKQGLFLLRDSIRSDVELASKRDQNEADYIALNLHRVNGMLERIDKYKHD